ncbi:hypothetical protein TeGR_g7002 [Tetraparma gracilis]|uniref:Aminotransferase class V domain-containing protein n=1 Tax=Tetraparma gracilis TaxID=2962635 RepID=A0ABQ6ML44_9STRA|nr:hypothetical protein TeGR_g7002 [Tetraparma gracilis]
MAAPLCPPLPSAVDGAISIHLNAAGASPSPPSVLEAITEHLQREVALGAYEASHRLARSSPANGGAPYSKLFDPSLPYLPLSRLLSVRPSCLALTQSAQHAFNLAVSSLDLSQPGQRVLAFGGEYRGNIAQLRAHLKRCEAEEALTVLPMLPSGLADVEALEAALADPRPGAPPPVVLLCHVNTCRSVVQPAAAVGSLVAAAGGIFVLDACQSAGMLPLDLPSLRADFACLTSRKWLRGPRGIGALYVSPRLLERPPATLLPPPSLDHSSAALARGSGEVVPNETAARYELWESSPALALGFAAAVSEALDVGVGEIAALSRERAGRLRGGLGGIGGLNLVDGGGEAPIVAFEAETGGGPPAAEIHRALVGRGIAGSVSPAGHSFDEGEWGGVSAVRFSPHWFVTEGQVDEAVEAVRQILESKGN